MRHGLRALHDTLPNELELTSKVFQNPFASVSTSKMSFFYFIHFRIFRTSRSVLWAKIWIPLCQLKWTSKPTTANINKTGEGIAWVG